MRPKKSDPTAEILLDAVKPEDVEEAPTLASEGTPEENKNPVNHEVILKLATSSEEDVVSNHSGSFSPPPALSPAYSLKEDVEEDEKTEEHSRKRVKMEVGSDGEEDGPEEEFEAPKRKIKKKDVPMPIRKIESSPAMVNLEKMKYNKRNKESLPLVDPHAPKRNRSAYVHFIIHRRSSYSKAVMSQRDININLAADWQKLTAEERKPFHKIAEEEKNRYAELLEEYKKTDNWSDFQKKRAQQKGKKRKSGTTAPEESDNDTSKEAVTMDFPKTSVFCPLLNNATSSESTATSSSSLQYLGPIFTPEFMAYNKARDSYRRQLTIERSTVEHELEALHEHDLEVKIRKQEERNREVDEQIEETMQLMATVFAGNSAAKEHLSDLQSLTNWLQDVSESAPRDPNRKLIKESLQKYCKSLKK